MTANKEEYGLDIVLDELKQFVNKFPTRTEAAGALGIGRVFLWRILDRQIPPTDNILKHIGFERERIVTYKYRKR